MKIKKIGVIVLVVGMLSVGSVLSFASNKGTETESIPAVELVPAQVANDTTPILVDIEGKEQTQLTDIIKVDAVNMIGGELAPLTDIIKVDTVNITGGEPALLIEDTAMSLVDIEGKE